MIEARCRELKLTTIGREYAALARQATHIRHPSAMFEAVGDHSGQVLGRVGMGVIGGFAGAQAVLWWQRRRWSWAIHRARTAQADLEFACKELADKWAVEITDARAEEADRGFFRRLF